MDAIKNQPELSKISLQRQEFIKKPAPSFFLFASLLLLVHRTYFFDFRSYDSDKSTILESWKDPF